jgi:alkanesulfonate monooxygenase SsuD/methylene tetrahydromethanopterin reductase-like flavin-dependent oxidoreductase (luciferase family)
LARNMELGICLFELRTGNGFEIDENIILDAARRAEQIGFDYVALPDRVSRPTYRFDTLTLAAAMAVQTKRIKIKTHVFVLPLRHPIELARRLVTLDYLSHGRFILEAGLGGGGDLPGAVGTVYNKEYVDVGVPHNQRGRRANEILKALRLLWTEPAATFEGKYYQFRDVEFNPKPYSKPYMPIWIGGNSEAALKRAARFGDGWSPTWETIDHLGGVPAVRQRLATERAAVGRDPAAEMHITGCIKINVNSSRARAVDEARTFWAEQRNSIEGAQSFEIKAREDVYDRPGALVEKLRSFQDDGMDSVVMHLHTFDVMTQLSRLEEEVLPRL